MYRAINGWVVYKPLFYAFFSNYFVKKSLKMTLDLRRDSAFIKCIGIGGLETCETDKCIGIIRPVCNFVNYFYVSYVDIVTKSYFNYFYF